MIFEMVEIIKDDIITHNSFNTFMCWNSSDKHRARINKFYTQYEIEYKFIDPNVIDIFLVGIEELRNNPIIIENCFVEYPRNYRVVMKERTMYIPIKYVNCIFLNDDVRSINKNIYVNCYSYQVGY